MKNERMGDIYLRHLRFHVQFHSGGF